LDKLTNLVLKVREHSGWILRRVVQGPVSTTRRHPHVPVEGSGNGCGK
jgi:hypothetical protein